MPMRSKRIEPGPGQESVWDYPRPPSVEPSSKRVDVVFAEVVVARSERAVRVLETAGPPTIYVPPDDVATELLAPTRHATVCEWKGRAAYYDIVVGERRTERAAWSYPNPKRGYERIAGWLSFYPARVEACRLGGELVSPQPGDFYGGWVTSDIVGPFKGGRGTWSW
jgi:uncharacterized protein (DUF427 family)